MVMKCQEAMQPKQKKSVSYVLLWLKPDTDDFTQSFLDYDAFLNLVVDQTCGWHIPGHSKPKRHKPSLATPPLPMVPALSPTP